MDFYEASSSYLERTAAGGQNNLHARRQYDPQESICAAEGKFENIRLFTPRKAWLIKLPRTANPTLSGIFTKRRDNIAGGT